jgi:hypothetical protein
MSETRERSEYTYWEGYSDGLNSYTIATADPDYLRGYNDALADMCQ